MVRRFPTPPERIPMTTPPPLDLAFVREQFAPLLDGWAFLENAGGAYVPEQVVARLNAYMRTCQVQPGVVGASEIASERLAESRNLFAALVNCAPDELVFNHSTTVNAYILAHALQPLLAEGDEIIVTDLDHEANNTPWRRLGESGARIVEWRHRPESGGLHAEDLRELLTERTRLVCFTALSNLTGTANDVTSIVRAAHEAGALACVDAVAYVAHRLLDAGAWDADAVLFSAYKLFGPHLGVMMVKRDLMLKARGQNHFFFGEDDIPIKLNVGGLQHEMVASLSGVVDYFDAVAHHHGEAANDLRFRLASVFGMIEAHEQRLGAALADYLAGHPKIRLLGLQNASAGRVPTFGFDVPGADLNAIQARLAEAKINVGRSHFYAPRGLEALGLDPARGILRASAVHYNSPEEIGRLIDALDAALR